MSTVICNREGCKFKTGTMCSKPYIILHAVGVCSEWYDKNGQPRQEPFYATIGEPYPTKMQLMEEGVENDVDRDGSNVSDNPELPQESMDNNCEEQGEAGDRID